MIGLHDIRMLLLTYLLLECWRLHATGCAGRMMTNLLSVLRLFDDAAPLICWCHRRLIRRACGTYSFRLLGQHLDDRRPGGSSAAVRMQHKFLCSPVTMTQETKIATISTKIHIFLFLAAGFARVWGDCNWSHCGPCRPTFIHIEWFLT